MADDRLPWFPCYPSKLLGALAGMQPHEGYVYWIVCLRIYETGRPCRDTADVLARRTGFPKRKVSEALELCFSTGRLVRTDDGIVNPFASEVLAEVEVMRETRSRAGQNGARVTNQKIKEKQQNTSGTSVAQAPAKSDHLHIQDSLFPNGNRAPMQEPEDPRKQLFDRGKAIFGQGSGGLIQKLLAAKHGNLALARAAVEQASTMDQPREYIGRVIHASNKPAAPSVGNGYAALLNECRTDRES
jgi:hypothetical protein